MSNQKEDSTVRNGIVVVGACNMDLISYVSRMPTLGESLHGTEFRMGYGGKGANQAVMAAKLGGNVTMVTKLGADTFGDGTRENLASFGIDTNSVFTTDQAFTGVAPIAVDPEGRNSIIVVTGANDLLTIDEIQSARAAIASAAVMVCQLEIPVEISISALALARELGVTTILNSAPAREQLPAEAYQLSDVFCPNESEAAMLTGLPVDTDAQAEAAAAELRRRGAGTVIMTLGERGALIADSAGTRRVTAETVEAVDSVGAGDAFVGTLAYLLATQGSTESDQSGDPKRAHGSAIRIGDLDHAVESACRVATRSVMRQGTQTSFPDRAEVEDLLG